MDEKDEASLNEEEIGEKGESDGKRDERELRGREHKRMG